MKKVFDFLKWFFKSNVIFGLGLIFGSIIGTVTTITFTMSQNGIQHTIQDYHQVICGENK